MLNNHSLPVFFSVLLVFLHLFVAPTHIHAQFDYPSFPTASGFSFVGDAGLNGSALRLIRQPPPGGAFTAAAVWHNETQRVTDGFVTTFTFRILNPQGSNGGGDGFAFVLHSGGTSTIGFGSAQMGYADPGGIPNSLAFEFDTYLNSNFGDPDANHFSIHTNFTGPNNANESFSIGRTSANLPYFRDGSTHIVKIEYDGPANSHQTRIFIDNLDTPVLTRQIDLSTILAGGGPTARVGFTGGAAGASENHDILSWTFTPHPNVTELTFHQIAPDTQRSVPIDGNPLVGDVPGTDYGLRIFPDKDLPTDGADRSTIRVDANIGTNVPDKMVYFRTFDMDDPSVNSAIDPDVAGIDNRGSVAGSSAGRIRIPPGMETICQIRTNSVACPTDSSGIASVNFTVTRQPGDNFAIAASTREAEVEAVNLDPTDGLHLLSAAATRVNSTCEAVEKVCRSRLLTVWRRLNIETDSMPTVDVNHVDVRLIPPPPGGPEGITIAAGETRTIGVWDPAALTLEDGRFFAGRARIGSSFLSVQNNTETEITVTNTSLNDILISYSSTFQLYDDDDYNNNNAANVIGDEGEPISSPDRLLIQAFPNGDNMATNVLALAYIRPDFGINDVSNGLAQQFKANIDSLSMPGLAPIISYDNIGTDGDDQFWTLYLLNAYQGEPYRDGDGIWIPTIKGDARRAMAAPPDPEESEVGFTLENDIAVSLIFAEPAGSKECNSRPSKLQYSCNLSAITAREVAKALGALPADGGLLNLESTVLSAASLDKIRGRLVP